MVEKIAFIDMDHTLADAAWRDGLLGGPWDDYHSAGVNDLPIQEMIALLHSMRGDWTTIGLTGRPERFRQMTMLWCLRYNAMLDELLMRADNDFSPAPEYKLRAIKQRLRHSPNALILVFDDRDDIVSVLKAQVNGIILQVSKGGANYGQNQTTRQKGSDTATTPNEPTD